MQNTERLTYFDNAATSFPKPDAVWKEMRRYIQDLGGPYGRSFYPRAIEVSATVEDTRNKLAEIMGTSLSDNIFFTYNATYGFNIVLWGLSLDNKEVLVSNMEHNAVMRPLNVLSEKINLKVKFLPSLSDGKIDISRIDECITGNTALVIVNHQSNVNGVIQPISEIKKRIGDIPLMLDLSQSIGDLDIGLDANKVDYAVFTGHKSLLGPTGIGGAFIRKPETVEAFVTGGTGSKSESFIQPEFMPDKFEAGTPNIVGIFGLLGGIENKPKENYTHSDFINLLNAIKNIEGINVYSANLIEDQGKVFSVTFDFASCSDLGRYLQENFGIEARVGMHCTPLAHKTLNTFPEGTLRFSPSVYHTKEDFDYLYNSLLSAKKHYDTK